MAKADQLKALLKSHIEGDDSHFLAVADITKACEDAIKDAIIRDREEVSPEDLLKPLQERQSIRKK